MDLDNISERLKLVRDLKKTINEMRDLKGGASEFGKQMLISKNLETLNKLMVAEASFEYSIGEISEKVQSEDGEKCTEIIIQYFGSFMEAIFLPHIEMMLLAKEINFEDYRLVKFQRDFIKKIKLLIKWYKKAYTG